MLLVFGAFPGFFLKWKFSFASVVLYTVPAVYVECLEKSSVCELALYKENALDLTSIVLINQFPHDYLSFFCSFHAIPSALSMKTMANCGRTGSSVTWSLSWERWV